MKLLTLWASAAALLGYAAAYEEYTGEINMPEGYQAAIAKNIRGNNRFSVRPKPPGVKPAAFKTSEVAEGAIIKGTFEQPLDHSDPSKGTFQQRFWTSSRYWGGPGSPVFVFNPGESNAANFLGYLDEDTMPGFYAKHFKGLVIIIEHRYWGESVPYDILTAETLQYLDLPQSIQDMTNFAANATIDIGNGTIVDNAAEAPWVLIGGSYPGALTAWVNVLDPGVFWAHHASSAVVQTISDFYTYFSPIAEALPANCSADVRAVVQYMDHVLSTGTDTEILELKSLFGLAQLKYHDDFAYQVSMPLRQWQDDPAYVFGFCDHLEVPSPKSGIKLNHPGGLGLTTALPRYAAFIKNSSGEACPGNTCNTHVNLDDNNTPDDFADGMRQWDWICCHNPFGWGQVGPNVTDGTNIVSQFVVADYFSRDCPSTFPETNGFTSGGEHGWTPEHLDLWTGGWDADFKRVLFVNGEVDPWRSATVSSDYRKGGRRESTTDAPIYIFPHGNHCPEMFIDESLPHMYLEFIKVMGRWLKEFVPASKR